MSSWAPFNSGYQRAQGRAESITILLFPWKPPFWGHRCLTEPIEHGKFLAPSWILEEGTLTGVGRQFSISSITPCLDSTGLPYLKCSTLALMRGNPDNRMAIISWARRVSGTQNHSQQFPRGVLSDLGIKMHPVFMSAIDQVNTAAERVKFLRLLQLSTYERGKSSRESSCCWYLWLNYAKPWDLNWQAF